MKIIAIIPARLNSQRLPRKLLKKIGTKFLFQIVYENAIRSNLIEKVIIATDSEEIHSICQENNINVILTPDYFQSGTDRIFWAYTNLHLNYDLILNIQADEPMLDTKTIDNFLEKISKVKFDVATMITRIESIDTLTNLNNVKVVIDHQNYAMYFSRSVIPYPRDGWNELNIAENKFYKHIGVYAYTPDALRTFASLSQSSYEKIEKLEQLRLLTIGAKYYCFEIEKDLISVDTQEDFEKVKQILESEQNY